MQTNLVTANDNSPADMTSASPRQAAHMAVQNRSWLGHSDGLITISEYSPVKRGVRILHTPVPAAVSMGLSNHTAKSAKRKQIGKFPVYALLLIWLLTVAGIARFAGGLSNNLLSGQNLAFAGGGLGLLSLALTAVAKRRGAKISHSIGIASGCVCSAGLSWYFLRLSGITIAPEVLGIGLAATSLILARIWRSPFLLHLSLLTALGLSAYSFLEAQVSDLAWLFPALWSMQMFLALEFRIWRTIALSIFTGLLWIGVNLYLLS